VLKWALRLVVEAFFAFLRLADHSGAVFRRGDDLCHMPVTGSTAEWVRFAPAALHTGNPQSLP